jgi:hypothetical protein
VKKGRVQVRNKSPWCEKFELSLRTTESIEENIRTNIQEAD